MPLPCPAAGALPPTLHQSPVFHILFLSNVFFYYYLGGGSENSRGLSLRVAAEAVVIMILEPFK